MKSRKPLASINITPLVDVLLILLVIMMIAMPLFAKKIPVDLPKTTLDAQPSVKNTLKVGIRADGQLLLQDAPVALPNLLSTVTESTSVEVYPDGKVSYDQLAQLVAKLQERHPRDVALMSQ